MIFALEDIDNEIPVFDEDTELEVACEAIANATRVADSLQQTLLCLERARVSKNELVQRQVLALASQHRVSVAEEFAVTGLLGRSLALESIEGSSLVIALEEEETKSKNILIRMLDAIANAFKWLWDKISSVFSSGESKEAAEEKCEKIANELENQAKITPNFPTGAKLTGEKYSKNFGYLGTSPSLTDLEKAVVEQTQLVDQFIGLVVDISSKMKEAASVESKFKADSPAETVAKEKADFDAGVLATIQKHLKTPFNNEQHGPYAAFKNMDAVALDKAYVIGPVISKSGPKVLGLAALKAGGYQAGTGTKKPDAVKAEIVLNGALASLMPLHDKITAFASAVGRMNDDLKNRANQIKGDAEAMQKAMKAIQAEASKVKNTEGAANIKAFAELAKSIGGLSGSLATTIELFRAASASWSAITSDAIAIAKNGDKKAGKEKKEEAPTKATEEPKK